MELSSPVKINKTNKNANLLCSEEAKLNPVLRIRFALQPTEQEKAARLCRRSSNVNYLLQRELAARFQCSETCIRRSEEQKRFPTERVLATRLAFQRKYIELFGEEFDDGAMSFEQGKSRLQEAMAI